MPGRFQSEGRRAAVVALSMILLLGVSLGLAAAFVRWHPTRGVPRTLGSSRQELQGLEFTLPRGWTETTRTRDPNRLMPARVYGDQRNPGRQLVVMVMEFASPRAPLVALGLAMPDRPARKPSEAELSENARPFRAGTLVGLRHTTKTNNGEQEHHLAVMTEDGRRYWAFMLMVQSDEFDADRDDDEEAASVLLEKVCRSAHDESYHDAAAADFEAVGLTAAGKPITPPGTLTARVASEDPADPPIVLVPSDAQPRLRMLRARVTAEVGGDDAAMTRARALLTAQFRLTMSRAPEPEELVEELVAERKALRVTYTTTARDTADAGAPGAAPGAGPGLIRQMWYAPLGDGRAALIESVSESVVSRRGGEDAAQLVALLKPTTERKDTNPSGTGGTGGASSTGGTNVGGGGSSVTTPSAPIAGQSSAAAKPGQTGTANPPSAGGAWTWLAAQKAGERMAVQLREGRGTSLPEGLSYLMIMRDRAQIGCQVSWTAPATPPPDDAKATRRGWTAVRFAEGRSRMSTQWSLSPEGNFTYLLWEHDSASDDEPEAWSLTGHDEKLTVGKGDGGASSTGWSMKMPDGFVPPMLEDAIVWDKIGEPTLLWMTVVREPPMPFVVYHPKPRGIKAGRMSESLPRVGGSDAPPPTAVVRPVMSLDADAIWIDEQGQMERTVANVYVGSPTGPVRLTISRVDRDELTKAFPAMEPKIKAWEKDPSKP